MYTAEVPWQQATYWVWCVLFIHLVCIGLKNVLRMVWYEDVKLSHFHNNTVWEPEQSNGHALLSASVRKSSVRFSADRRRRCLLLTVHFRFWHVKGVETKTAAPQDWNPLQLKCLASHVYIYGIVKLVVKHLRWAVMYVFVDLMYTVFITQISSKHVTLGTFLLEKLQISAVITYAHTHIHLSDNSISSWGTNSASSFQATHDKEMILKTQWEDHTHTEAVAFYKMQNKSYVYNF